MKLTGPFRAPAQMLAEQSYGGHKSLHDAESAATLGLRGAPIEGPTHFSQFEPLAAMVWGDRWFSHGCISAHFQNMVIEGEEVQAEMSFDGPGSTTARIDARKSDGTSVLSVLTNAFAKDAGFVARQPSIGLFIDLEVRMINGPVLVGHQYRLERELVALGQSKRTESYWTRITLFDGDRTVAEVLLHQGVFKASYAAYPVRPVQAE